MAERQFVVFRLDSERYGIDIKNVSSISEYIEITKVPDAKPLLEGIINLRGEIIPVVNLKRQFNLLDYSINSDTRIIIYKTVDSVLGFLVDEASQVLYLDSDVIEPAPDIVRGSEREYIAGIGKVDGKLIILLDLDRISEDCNGKAQQIIC